MLLIIISLVIFKYFIKKGEHGFVNHIFRMFAFLLFFSGLTLAAHSLLLIGKYQWIYTCLNLITLGIALSTLYTVYKNRKHFYALKTYKQFSQEIITHEKYEKQLQEHNTILMQIKKLAKVGSFQWWPHTGDIVWGENTYNIFEVPKTEVLTRNMIVKLAHPDDVMLTNTNINVAETKKFHSYEFRIITLTGKIKHLKVLGELTFDEHGEVDKVLGAVIDITESKMAAAELAQANKELQSFAYVASHDLQEPLRKMRAFSDMLSREVISDKGKKFVHKIEDAAERMTALVNDVLELSTIKDNLKMVDHKLCDSIKVALDDLDMRVRETNATVNVACGGLTVTADPKYLSQVFMNLVNNAIKFSKQTPVIDIWCEETSTETLVYVRDNGIGMDMDSVRTIFEPFRRLNARHEYAGSGIGLAIVKKIVDLHKATIDVSSMLGEGTTFSIAFPKFQEIPTNIVVSNEAAWSSN
jgi:signal transduction histidine kinase